MRFLISEIPLYRIGARDEAEREREEVTSLLRATPPHTPGHIVGGGHVGLEVGGLLGHYRVGGRNVDDSVDVRLGPRVNCERRRAPNLFMNLQCIRNRHPSLDHHSALSLGLL